ncbi:hypothetical protein NX905_29905 [Burkholderia thailandensis]|uniref:hypothetical protein n=1 Tax=Burkholderia thailandensis TaxID=57975 RepID=UPI00217E6B8D|nr:hypothetical protein [Burkholderia thailandensis]MCS6498385.1 hypothetical protein [Burkholderia thailandensis]
MLASVDPTRTGFVAEIDGCRCCIEGGPSPIAERIDWRWTQAKPGTENLDGSDPYQYEVIATGETVTPLKDEQQIVAWIEAHQKEEA